MSRLKNGGKKGFVRLSNEDSVMLNESDSEVELLDVTEINPNHGGKSKHRPLTTRQGSGDGCCCSCCVSFYLLLLTLLLVILTVFCLFIAYDLKLTKSQMKEMTKEMETMKKDYVAVVTSHNDASANHTSWLSLHTVMLLNHTHLLAGIKSTEHLYGKQLQVLSTAITNRTAEIAALKKATSQLDTKQMERVNASMAVVSSFSSEVSGIHTSMAQLDSRMDGLVNKVTSTNKYCNDFGTKIESITETTGDLQDIVADMKTTNMKKRKELSNRLTALTYIVGNHTQTINGITDSFNYTSSITTLQYTLQELIVDMERNGNETRILRLTIDEIINELKNYSRQSMGTNESPNEVPHDNEGDSTNAGSNSDPTGDAGSDGDPTGDTGSDGDSTGDTGSDGDSTGDAVPNNDPTGDAQDIDTTGPNSDVTTPTISTTPTIQETTPTIQATSTIQITATNLVETPVTAKPHPLDEETVANNITSNNSTSDHTPDHTPTPVSNETLGNDSNKLATPTFNESDVVIGGERQYPDGNHNNDEDGDGNHDKDKGGDIGEEVGESPEETPPNSKGAVLQEFLEMFDKLDSDGDNLISQEEFFQLFPQQTSVFPYLDSDNDQYISREEVLVAIDDLNTPTNNDNDTPPHYE